MFAKQRAESADGQAEAKLYLDIQPPTQSNFQIRTTNTSLKNTLSFYTEAVSTKRKRARLGNARNVRPKREFSLSDDLTNEIDVPMEESRPGSSDDSQGMQGSLLRIS